MRWKKICTWKQPPGRRLFPQIEVIRLVLLHMLLQKDPGASTRGSLAAIAIVTSVLAGCAVSVKSVGAVIHARLLAVFF